MKKVSAFLLSGFILLASILPASAIPVDSEVVFLPNCYLRTSSEFSTSSIEDIIDLYAQFHADSLRTEKQVVITNSTENSKVSASVPCGSVFSDEVIADEQRRIPLIEEMENKLRLVIKDAWCEPEVLEVQRRDTDIMIHCYIKTFFHYVDISQVNNPDAPVDLSGYGVHHTLTFHENGNGRYTLISDAYDEGHLTNMRSTSYTAEGPENNEVKITSGEKSIIIEGPPAGYSPLQATSSIKYFGNRGRWLTYYTNEGVAYSDKYALSYNPNFYTFEGADCANFASQCIDAGTRQTARDDKFKPYTSAWTSSTNSLKNWNDGYTWKLNPEDTWMSAGQLIYYDWNGTGGYQSFSHTTYCVGTDSSGVPIVNSHTTDKYHVRWNYGGSNCKYATFAIAG